MPINDARLAEIRALIEPQLKARENRAYEKGKADALAGILTDGGSTPAASSIASAIAQKLAARARAIQTENPLLSSIEAVRRVYEEAGVPLG